MNASIPLAPERSYLTDVGLEPTLIFHNELDLPCFAAFDLLKDEAGRETLLDYYRRYADMAVESKCGFIFESPTWRASRDWGKALGYDEKRIAAFNREAFELMDSLRSEYENEDSPMVVSGSIGPRGDGYVVGQQMTVDESRRYHQHQVDSLVGADLISAITMTYVDEAIGVVKAAQRRGCPFLVISKRFAPVAACSPGRALENEAALGLDGHVCISAVVVTQRLAAGLVLQ